LRLGMKHKITNRFQGKYHDFYSRYLQSVKNIGGDEYQALCPLHEDTNPSFNFNNKSGIFYCHGCGKKGHIFHFYARINGYDTRRDFPKILRGIASDFGIPWEQQKSKIVNVYDYTDEDGNLLYQTCRKEPKDFAQRHRNGKGGWIWNLKGVRRVLYVSGFLYDASRPSR
jgi:DNA primase